MVLAPGFGPAGALEKLSSTARVAAQRVHAQGLEAVHEGVQRAQGVGEEAIGDVGIAPAGHLDAARQDRPRRVPVASRVVAGKELTGKVSSAAAVTTSLRQEAGVKNSVSLMEASRRP